MDNLKMCIRILPGIVILFFFPEIAFTQAFLKTINPDDYKGNFRELAKEIDMFYDTATGSNRAGSKQWKRGEWFALHHLDEGGQLGNYIGKNIIAMEEMDRQSTENSRMPGTGAWINLGHASTPGAMALQGRVNNVAFDPVNSAIVYVASAAGGIWKTFNNGDSWTNLTIDLPILGIADIVVTPGPNNHIIYALTGDGEANAYLHNSVGVIKSYNNGQSWTRTNLTVPLDQSLKGYRLLMHPTDPNTLLAAMSDGIHRTMDGGNTWNLIEPVAHVNDMEFDLNHLDTLYYTRRNTNIFSKLNLVTLSTTNISISTTLNVDRMEIAVTPDNPDAVYLLAGPGYSFFGGNLFNGLFYSNNSGHPSSWVLRSVSCNNNGDLFNSEASIAFYANTLYVDPLEENYVMVGGLNLFNSVDGGVTLNQVTFNSIHADQHIIKRNPLNGNLWLCNDGGIYRSTDSGNTWVNKSNGLTINEYYRISGTNNTDDRLLGGTQDNGHFLRDGVGSFQFVMSGDGMDNYFNSLNNSIVYASSQYGGLNRSVNWGQSFPASTLPNAGDQAFYPWITPFVQHPPYFNSQSGQWEDTDVIYVYSLNGIMRSTDAINWSNIGPSNIGQFSGSLCPSMSIGADNTGNTNLYISNGNNFWACFNPLDGTPNWLPLSLPISNTSYISAINVNPANRTEVWATISGYQAGIKVFRSLNSGLNWNNMSLSLPNTPIYSLVFANNTNNPSGAVYVGTEIGVFYKHDGLPDWVPFSNGLPHVPVTDLQMNYITSELKCSTYGRGIWETGLYESCQPTVHVNYEINQGQYNFESSNLIYAYRPIGGGIGTRVTMKAAGQVRLQNGFRVYPDSYVRIAIGNCGSGPLSLTDDPSNLTDTIEAAKVKNPEAERN
ncbi:MAG TPA: hypothetical protein VI603_15795 [Saprospiraceae bacterium]|nr:hypothetical protein [Saprospiraceae bacterium]